MGFFSFLFGKEESKAVPEKVNNGKKAENESAYMEELRRREAELDAEIALRKEQENHPYWLHLKPEGDSESPEQYEDAKVIWANFKDYYFKYCQEDGFDYELPCLQCILNIAPKIGDEVTAAAILDDISRMSLGKYEYESIKFEMDKLPVFVKFYDEVISYEPKKQTDLVKIIEAKVETDGRFFIFVLRQFGMINVTKEGRYNIVTKK